MKVYIVVQEGVYRQRILGVFADLTQANYTARTAAAKDSDDYHLYVVYEAALNTPVEDLKDRLTIYQQKRRRTNPDPDIVYVEPHSA